MIKKSGCRDPHRRHLPSRPEPYLGRPYLAALGFFILTAMTASESIKEDVSRVYYRAIVLALLAERAAEQDDPKVWTEGVLDFAERAVKENVDLDHLDGEHADFLRSLSSDMLPQKSDVEAEVEAALSELREGVVETVT